MIVACVLITHIRAKAELRRRPELENRAFVIVDRIRAEAPVVDLSPPARGILPGMTLQQAMSIQPGLIALDADEPHYRDTFARLLDSLGYVSDMVQDGGPGEAYVRLDGLERLYGGEARAVSALLNAVPAYLNPRVGVAGSKFPAYAAARAAASMRAAKAPDDVSAFLAPLSIGLLPVSIEVKSALYRFGLRLLGDVASTGRTAMFDRFGKEGATVWELSTGQDRRPFVPRKVEESIVESAALPFSTTSMEMLRAALDILLRRAFARPVLRNRSVGTSAIESSGLESGPWKLRVRFKVPVEHWERASELLGERIDNEPPKYPINDLTLSLSDLGGEPGVQAGLLKDARESGRAVLIEVDRRLRGTMEGMPALYRAVEVAPWHPLPEMRSLRAPLDPLGAEPVRSLHAPSLVSVRESEQHLPLAVRIGNGWRRVVEMEDVWRVDLWWLPRPVNRTYFRVAEAGGRRLTLFRDGSDGVWYRHPG